MDGEVRVLRGDRWQNNRLAKIQGQITEKEESHIFFRTFDGILILLLFETGAVPCEAHTISPCFNYQEDAGQ